MVSGLRKYPLPLGEISADVIWGKNYGKVEPGRGEIVKKKIRKKRERKKKKGERGKKYHFQRGGGNNIVFRTEM